MSRSGDKKPVAFATQLTAGGIAGAMEAVSFFLFLSLPFYLTPSILSASFSISPLSPHSPPLYFHTPTFYLHRKSSRYQCWSSPIPSKNNAQIPRGVTVHEKFSQTSGLARGHLSPPCLRLDACPDVNFSNLRYLFLQYPNSSERRLAL